MALIGYEGFDNYNVSQDMLTQFGAVQCNYVGNVDDQWNFAPGRGGFGRSLFMQPVSLAFQDNSLLRYTIQSPTSFFTLGVGMNFLAEGGTLAFAFSDAVSGDTFVSWFFDSAHGIIKVTNAAGSILASGLNCIVPTGWLFYEMQMSISGTAGSVKLRVNGQPVLGFPDVTGINTLSGTSTQISSVNITTTTFPGTGQTIRYLIDDMYFADGTTGPGAFPANGFLGDTRCSSLLPIANDSVQFTPSPIIIDTAKTASNAGDTHLYFEVDHEVDPVLGDLYGPMRNVTGFTVTTTLAGAIPAGTTVAAVDTTVVPNKVTLSAALTANVPVGTPISFGGSTNWLNQAEASFDGDNSYNISSTVGAQDSFTYPVLDVNTDQIIAVAIKLAVRKDDANSRTIAPIVVIAGVTYVGNPVSVDLSYLFVTTIFPINPATNASWTVSDVNGAKFGYKIVS